MLEINVVICRLIVQQNIQVLRRNRRTVLRSLEQTHRSALEDHVHRTAEMGHGFQLMLAGITCLVPKLSVWSMQIGWDIR